MNMSSSEIHGWQEYFTIYPFRDMREDIRHAELLAMIINSQGRMAKSMVSPKQFIPNYLGENKPVSTEKSLDQQYREMLEFKKKYDAAGQG